LKNLALTESKLGFGASLGGFAQFEISENFAVQPELLFHFKSSTDKTNIPIIGTAKNDFRYWGAEIPVYALGKWDAGRNGKFYAGVGPYVGVGFSAKYNNTDLDLYKKYRNNESVLRRFDFGFGAMLGYEFNNGIQINAGYKIGVLDVMDAGRKHASMLPQTASLGLGYRF
jgi:hypothetical protein